MEGSWAPFTDTSTSTPSFSWLPDCEEELLRDAVDPLLELDGLPGRDAELELDGEELPGEDGEPCERDEELLGMDGVELGGEDGLLLGDDGDELDDEEDELGMDGMDELLELEEELLWQPASSREPITMARVESLNCVDKLLCMTCYSSLSGVVCGLFGSSLFRYIPA